MNKKITLVAVLLLMISSLSFGQVLNPSKWTVELSQEKIKVGDVIDVVFKAKIDKDWHLYSNDFDANLGPILISFDFEDHASYELIGKVKPINSHKHFDEIWEGEVSYFKNTAEMRQKIKVKSLPLKIEGTFDFQSCSNVSGQCVMGDDEFDLTYPTK